MAKKNKNQPECPICMGECHDDGYCPTCDIWVDEDAYYDEDYDEEDDDDD